MNRHKPYPETVEQHPDYEVSGESVADYIDVQGAYNVWSGLYEKCRQGNLNLDGLKSHINDRGVMEVSLPHEPPKLMILRVDNQADSIFVSYVSREHTGEKDGVGEVVDLQLKQDGKFGERKVYEALMSKSGRLLSTKLSSYNYVLTQDLEKIDAIFCELQMRRSAWMEKRMQDDEPHPKESWLGRIASRLKA